MSGVLKIKIKVRTYEKKYNRSTRIHTHTRTYIRMYVNIPLETPDTPDQTLWRGAFPPQQTPTRYSCPAANPRPQAHARIPLPTAVAHLGTGKGNAVTFVGAAPPGSAIRIPTYLWTRLRASPSPSHGRDVVRVGYAASRSRQNTA